MVRLLTAKATILLLSLFVIVGHLGDRFQMKKRKDRKSGRSFDVWEFGLLIAIPIMIFSLYEAVVNLWPYLSQV